MSPEEEAILGLLVQVWNKFICLSTAPSRGGHPDDIEDFRHHLHRLQDMVAARSGYRYQHYNDPVCKEY